MLLGLRMIWRARVDTTRVTDMFDLDEIVVWPLVLSLVSGSLVMALGIPYAWCRAWLTRACSGDPDLHPVHGPRRVLARGLLCV